MLDRAYSTFHIKALDPVQRVIEGVASTPTVDRHGDSMDPKGAEFSLPMPFLWFHDSQSPIGEVIAADVRADGIHIRAKISQVSTPGRFQTLTNEAWAAMSATPPLVRGLSIGWKPLKVAPIPGTTFQRVKSWVLGEISAVTVPANVECTIYAIKSLDQQATAASGTRPSGLSTPGASGSRSGFPTMNVSEQLTKHRADLQTKAIRLDELMTADDQNGGLDAEESTERSTLENEVKALTAKVSHLQTLESAQASLAKTLDLGQHAGAVQAGTPSFKRVEVVAKEYPKGTIFTRYAMAIAAGKGSYSDTLAYAKRWTDTPQVALMVKTAVEGTSVVASPGWGGELVNPNTAQTEFVELVRAATIIGRVPGFRMVPFNIPIITQTGGSTFEWVGEGGVKPVGELAFDRTTMPHNKVAGIIVLSEELIRLSTPAAEATVRTDLTEQCARFLDEQFIQVAISAGADNPASITNGVASPSATGTTLAALLHDLQIALATFDTANIPTDGLVIVTTPAVARILSMMTNSLGQTPSGFNVSATGGTLLGYPVIVSSSVDAATLVIFKPSEILLADDGQVRLDSSNQATLDMAGSTSPTFSLWQRNCVGIRAERWIRWQKRRAGVVAVLDTIAYVPGT